MIFNIGIVRSPANFPNIKQGGKMERIKANPHVVGLKQTKKTIEANKAHLVFIAQDADGYMVAPLEKLCEENSVEIVYVDSMKELGRACHIEVPTAVATIVKNT